MRGTVEMAGKSRATRFIASRISCIEVTPRMKASFRSRASFLTIASSGDVGLDADNGGGVRDETRTGGGSLFSAAEFFSFDIFPYYLLVGTLEASVRNTSV
jgi:hypothetical protein